MRIPFIRKRRPTAIDPVCNMSVNTINPTGGTWDHCESVYYFCSPGCNRAFQKEPHMFLSGEKRLDMK